ncbi:type IV secretory system conjugative DNA transfer family protein [Methylobacterium sp. E-046]|uniref:type IV secretory system conjugative DNA transfer family protein n=1 Tax=Methylobacterium sp. E-046 TaxID=2836576 RepID=UPI001FBBC6A7|nr:type IV secretory system conjugative DNA transfer family protein [Methylobacterium sp. E-046]MCJ2097469.1 type IV secretory system conjugative DNA transfer family protein [Methylobacterium sp. E-046]
MFRKAKPPPPSTTKLSDPGDVIADFPRGVAATGNERPTASARWLSSDELAARVPHWRPGMFLIGRDHTGRPYGIADDRHILTVAGSRAGKGVSLIVPNLLFWPGSCLAIDPKGELATLTASRRSALGSAWSLAMDPGQGKVFALDPFERVSGPAARFRAAFNPLADLDPQTERGIDLSWMIADALVMQSKGDGAFWTQSARAFLRGVILFVAATEPPASKTLIRVRALLTQPRDEFEAMLERMKAQGDLIAASANAMINRPPNERQSVLSTCEVHTAFLEGPSMQRVLRTSNFRLEDLKSERVTVYLSLPATKLSTHGRWLRMMVALAMDAMERTGPAPAGKPPVLFVLDEFAALGHMETVESAAGQIASFGVKLWPIVQDITQLQRDYDKAWETFMGNAGLLTFWGNTDLTTTDHIAKRLGDTEVIRAVINANETWQRTTGRSVPDWLGALAGMGNASTTAGESQTGGRTLNQQLARTSLMAPDEIARHFARDAGNILAAIAQPDLPAFALHRFSYFGKEDAALFGGLYDPMPEQKPPHTTAAERESRDRDRLWHVPVQ